MNDDDDITAPGTAPAARIKKAACGIRYDNDELSEGIDFSGADALRPGQPGTDDSPDVGENRQGDSHPKPT